MSTGGSAHVSIAVPATRHRMAPSKHRAEITPSDESGAVPELGRQPKAQQKTASQLEPTIEQESVSKQASR